MIRSVPRDPSTPLKKQIAALRAEYPGFVYLYTVQIGLNRFVCFVYDGGGN